MSEMSMGYYNVYVAKFGNEFVKTASKNDWFWSCTGVILKNEHVVL